MSLSQRRASLRSWPAGQAGGHPVTRAASLRRSPDGRESAQMAGWHWGWQGFLGARSVEGREGPSWQGDQATARRQDAAKCIWGWSV